MSELSQLLPDQAGLPATSKWQSHPLDIDFDQTD